MSSGSGKTSTTQTSQTTNEPWAKQQPFLEDVYGRAKTMSQTPQEYFPGATVAGFAPETETAQGYQTLRALAGSPLNTQAQGLLSATMGGQFLGAGNPYFGQMSDSIYNQIRPRMDAQFKDQYGSPQHAYASASALSQALAPIAYQNYGTERGYQNSAMAQAAPMAQADYYDAAKLAEVGASREAQTQALMDEQVARFNFQQQAPYQALGQYAGLLGGVVPGNSLTVGTNQQPKQPIGMGLLGAGLSAASLAGQLGAFASDRRVKTDIKQVGLLFNDLPVYSFRYKTGGPTQIGLMAQDVEKEKPEAVITIGGVKHVHYGMAAR